MRERYRVDKIGESAELCPIPTPTLKDGEKNHSTNKLHFYLLSSN